MAKRTVPGLAFLLAALCTAAAVYARWLLSPWLGHTLPLATVFAAVAVSAWLGGYRPAVFATLAGYAASMYLFVDPRVLPLFDTPGEVIGFALYLASCAVIIVFGAGMRHAERRVTRLLESITDAFVAVDREWRYTYVNAEAERLLGRSRRSMIGKKIWEVDPDAPGSELERQLRLAADSRTTQEFESHLPTSGRWFLNKVYPVPNGGLAIHFRDVSERKRAAAALLESEERFRHMADQAPVMIWVTDTGGDVTFLSRSWYELTGMPHGSGLGRAWTEALHEDDRARFAEAFARASERHEPFRAELRVRRHDGEYRWAICAAAPRFGADGDFLGYVGSVMDITDRKNAEDALREADRRKDEFLATLAHELRNPLAPIRNAVEIVRVKDPGDRELRAARDIIDRQVQQMTRLVEDLLDVSRITRGKVQLRRERVELSRVLQDAVVGARPLVSAGGQELTVSLPPEPAYLDADPTRVTQIVLNLLNNAAKYTPKGGRIWLTAERDGAEVVISVRDTGIGIPAEHLPHIFEMFSQVTPALERAQGGLGIGLSLVRGLVELHGGRVEARSDGQGRGSEFVVRLPALEAPAGADHRAGGERRPASAGASRRVLVVDDNRDAADSLRAVLQLAGHEVRTAYDGEAAVYSAATWRPEVVLLDIGLPGMNGYEAAARIRRAPWGAGMVLVAVTGWGQEEDKRRAVESGFDVHLTKPVDLDSLASVLSARDGRAGGSLASRGGERLSS